MFLVLSFFLIIFHLQYITVLFKIMRLTHLVANQDGKLETGPGKKRNELEFFVFELECIKSKNKQDHNLLLLKIKMFL